MAKIPKRPNRKTEEVSLSPILRSVTLDASTIDSETRTVELVFYSGVPVLRIPMFDDPFELEFVVSKKAANLERLNAGAALIDSHGTYRGVNAILGVVEKAWLADGMARARVRFSKRDEVEPVWQDVEDKVIQNVSMGVYLHELEEVTEEGAPRKRFRATSWEPYEISLVAVPADAGAQVQASGEREASPCSVTFCAEALADARQRGNEMIIKVRLLADTDNGKSGEIVEIEENDFDETLHSKELETAEETVAATIKRDKEHAAELKRIAAHYGLDSVWAQRHINLGTTIDQALAEAADERARRAPKTTNEIGFGDDRDSSHWRREQMESAIAARARRIDPPESARQYAHTTLLECALEALSWTGKHQGLDVRRDGTRILQLALHTTSDFPLLLANALNKVLLPEYALAAPTYRMIAERKTFNDFRPHTFNRSGDFPVPLQVNEHGEYKYGTMGENAETVTLATYGRIIGLSRQTIVNDDLSAFANLATKAARRIADFENATFFLVCISAGAGLGPALSDTVVVYNAAHGNITAAGALSNALLGEGLGLMMAQTSLDGLKLNIVPRFVLVSPTSVVAAKTFLAAIMPTQASEVNPFAGEMTAIGDANLTGTRFYMLADPSQLANYIYGYLAGDEGPRTDVRAGFEIDGVEFKISLDFAVGAIDYRGGVTGAGA
jgi:pyruvoyl-dependent arginine decarboxylase (PvlArgDC)